MLLPSHRVAAERAVFISSNSVQEISAVSPCGRSRIQ